MTSAPQAVTPPMGEAIDPQFRASQRSAVRRFGGFVRSKPLGAFGLLIIVIVLFTALFADQLATHQPNRTDPIARLGTPSSEHWLGTDHLGRDIYSRVVYGARVSAVVGPLSVALAMVVAFILGLAPGFIGGKTDFATQRLVDILTSFPPVVILLTVVQMLATADAWPTLGPLEISESMQRAAYIIIVLGLIMGFPISRIVRASAISIRQLQYIEAARSMGVPTSRLLLRHVLPNVMPLIITLSTASLGAAILIEAGISYLGVGLPPDIPSWGLMLSESRNYIATALNVTIWPGAAIALTVFGFNMLGDALRDVLDPRLRGA